MKQLFQNLKTGEILVDIIPAPAVGAGHVLIQTARSLISLGTERMLVSFGQANLFEKARQQPDKVKQVVDKIKTDGLKPALDAVFSRLDEPMALGYSNAGIVIAIGKGVTDIVIGDRVVSNGPHAEVVSAPRNLVAKIPERVSFDEACFTVVASIGLQGIRCVQPTLGETIVVNGLGLIGQLTAQLLKINGCRVIGLDIDEEKVVKARELNIEAYSVSDRSPVRLVEEVTEGIGADGVIVTASSKSEELIASSAKMCRKRGRIILVGSVGLNLNRADFYEKELTFQVSCSYGPGRYDSQYENFGYDYPLPYVRWTENRNFKAVLRCIGEGELNVMPLVSKRTIFEGAPDVYKGLTESHCIATIIEYPETPIINGLQRSIAYSPGIGYKKNGTVTLGVIGAGVFTKSTMLPVLVKSGAVIKYICSKNGASSTHLAKKFGIEYSTTSFEDVIHDSEVTAVIIATRHNMHAKMTCEAFRAEKHVFVEKPLALNRGELEDISQAHAQAGVSRSLMVGFNRRFSPLIIKLKTLLGEPCLINAVFTINAGFLPKIHWTQDPALGGGRIVGEACHFIDLFTFLSGSPIIAVCASSLGRVKDLLSDNVSILLKCENGSCGVVNYYSNGDKKWPKETIEVFSDGRVARINNFRSLITSGFKRFDTMKLRRQDKGHREQFRRYVEFLEQGGEPLIPNVSLMNVMQATFGVLDSLSNESWIQVS